MISTTQSAETSPKMLISSDFKGDFYDADYFERGRTSGKSWLQDYRWMPRRSFREAFAYIDYLGLCDDSYVLDFGCSKGFIVRALRELGIPTEGCDISDYALSFAPEGCWDCSDVKTWNGKFYTHIVCKDVFEHFTIPSLDKILPLLRTATETLMCIIPMGDNGKYRITEYHQDISHLIAESESWWLSKFRQHGWKVIKHTPHVPGLKDNWQDFAGGIGNHVFVLGNTNLKALT